MPEPPEKPIRGRPRKMNADAVRDIAMNAYWQKDPADVSINAICQMAGVSKPSVYREFGSEDGLSLATLDHYAHIVLSDVFAILHSGLGMAETLGALIEFASADPRMETGCLFHKMLAGKHRLGPKTVARVNEIDAAPSRPTAHSCRRTAKQVTGTAPSASRTAHAICPRNSLLPSRNALRAKTKRLFRNP